MLKSPAANMSVAITVSTLLGSHLALAQSVEEPTSAGDSPAAEATEAAEPQEAGRAAEEGATAAPEEIQEVVVLGENIPEPMARTAEISSYLLPEDLQRQGDDTAAAALRRVTGLSVNQGKFVYVRGLGERYSASLLNGSALPSPEPLQRVVPLDLFPSNIIANVLVQKTYSARYPGEFGGGLIDIQTVAVPDDPFFTVSFSTGADSETTFKDGITHYGSDTDFLGFDDDIRDVPDALAQAIATGRRVDAGNFSPAELQTIGRSLANAPLNLLQSTDDVVPAYSADLTGGTSFPTEWGSIGLITVAGIDNSWQSRVGQQQEGFVSSGVISPETSYDFRSTQNDVVVNGLVGLGAEWGRNSVNWTNLYIHNTTKETRSRVGNDERAGAFVRDDFTEWFERELLDTQLAGTHAVGAWGIEWRGSFARTTRDAPYEKGIRYRRVGDEWLHNASQEQNYTRFSEVEDEVASAGLDVSYSFAASGRQDTVLSAGIAWLDNERTSESREFRLLALDGALPLDVQRERVDFLLSNVNIAPGLLSIRETTGADGAAAYDAALTVDAAYLQLDAEFVPLLRTSFGVRYEDAEESVTPRNLFAGPAPTSAPPLVNDYFLPTGTVTWNFYENMQLRFGASKTIGRPQFRELAPQQYLDTDSDRLFIGNPFLTDTEMVNFDTRYEWYFDPGEFFTAGIFYKQLDRPIETIVNEAGSTVQQTYINAPEATLYGAELEVKKYLGVPLDATWWGDKRLFVGANYTYTDSEVKVSEGDVVFPLSGGGAPSPAIMLVRDGSRMQGQSEHLANLQLGIESVSGATQLTLLATYVGERISARGRPGQPDFIQEPGTVVDLVFRQAFGAFGQDLSFGFEARNLLQEDFEEYQELGGGRVNINQYDLGSSLSVSLTARF